MSWTNYGRDGTRKERKLAKRHSRRPLDLRDQDLDSPDAPPVCETCGDHCAD